MDLLITFVLLSLVWELAVWHWYRTRVADLDDRPEIVWLSVGEIA